MRRGQAALDAGPSAIPHEKVAGRPCIHAKYRLTCAEFDSLRQRAQDQCEICGILGEDTPHGVLHIDHDSAVGVWGVRGLLCSRCNTGLDRDAVVTPKARARYLSNPFHALLPPKEPTREQVLLVTEHVTELTTLGEALQQDKARYEATRATTVAAIFKAVDGGVPQVEIVKATGYTRERIRQLVDAERKRREEAAKG